MLDAQQHVHHAIFQKPFQLDGKKISHSANQEREFSGTNVNVVEDVHHRLMKNVIYCILVMKQKD